MCKLELGIDCLDSLPRLNTLFGTCHDSQNQLMTNLEIPLYIFTCMRDNFFSLTLRVVLCIFPPFPFPQGNSGFAEAPLSRE